MKLFDSELKVMGVLWTNGDMPARRIAAILTESIGWNVNTTYTLIKRCIATGGQTVDLVDGRVVVDGVALDEPYTRGLPSEPLKTALGVEVSYPYTVPAGHLWVMGDNRTNSNDSRYFGAIDEDTLTGRAALVYWPFSNFGLLD